MMTDIRNLQAFALYMQKTDIKFDLYSVTKEMEKQVYVISLQYFLYTS
jgi:aarF domain-containing kinase